MVIPGPWLRNCGSFDHTLNNGKHLEILSEYFATVTHKVNINPYTLNAAQEIQNFILLAAQPHGYWLGLDERHANYEV